MPGCELRVSPDFVYPVVTSPLLNGLGRASVSYAIPAIPALAGARVFFQWYVFDPTPARPAGVTSRALQVTLLP